MDMLLGSFTKKYINELDESDLFDLSDLLNQEDEILYKYKNDEDTTNKIKETKISKLFKIFNYKLK
jgi:antitoxin CptB